SLVLCTIAACGVFSAQPAAAQRGGFQPAGPPAPVPPEVAIPRPRAAEVEAVQAAIKKFKDGTDGATKALLEKYPDLITVRAPGPNSAIAPSLNPGFNAKHSAN